MYTNIFDTKADVAHAIIIYRHIAFHVNIGERMMGLTTCSCIHEWNKVIKWGVCCDDSYLFWLIHYLCKIILLDIGWDIQGNMTYNISQLTNHPCFFQTLRLHHLNTLLNFKNIEIFIFAKLRYIMVKYLLDIIYKLLRHQVNYVKISAVVKYIAFWSHFIAN